MRTLPDLSVYLVTDRPLCGGRPLEEVVAAAVRGGCGLVQLREKHISTGEFVAVARRLKHTLDSLGIPLLINDRIDVALAVNAAGAHVGQSDMPWEDARRLLGPDKILGLTIDSYEELLESQTFDVDYLGVGPVYATSTKSDPAPTWGLESFQKACAASKHPVVGIGGVDAANAEQVIRCGAHGVAVVSAVCAAPSPERAAAELLQAVRRGQDLLDH